MLLGGGVKGQQSITVNTAITQDFSMGTSGTATLPAGFKIGTDWSSGSTATTLAYGTSGTGAVTGTSSGGVINWANGVTGSSTERSLGFLTTGSFTSPRSIIYAFTNNTGATVTSIDLSWNYEKSRSGSRAFEWTFFHGNTSTASTAATAGDQSYAADANNTVISNPPLSVAKSFTLTGLSIANGSTYYLRWTYTGSGGSSNSQGLSIDDFSITLPPSASAPTLTTPTATSITDVSATLGANITSDGGSTISARGTAYKTASSVAATDNPLVEGGTATGVYSHSRTGLTPQTQYFYAGYATNTTGTGLSTEGNFRTLSTAPTAQSSGVSTSVISSSQINLTITAATFPGTGATQGGYVVIYSTGTPTLSSTNGQAPAAGVGTIFATAATNLPSTPSTAVNVTGLASGNTYNFLVIPYTWDGTNAATYNYLTTSAPTANATTSSGAPALSTPTVSAITHNSATLGATVTSDGGSALSARGTSYNTSSPVAAGNNQLAEGGTSVAAFSHSRTSLTPQTQYFYAGYATNSSSTALSSEGNFRTLSSPPTVQAGLSATAASTTQINLTITAATFPGSGATQAGYIVIYATGGTPTFASTNGQVPAAGGGFSIFATPATVLPTAPSTTVNVTGLTQSTLYNFLVIPYTWDGTNASTYNYLTASAPTANATTQGPVTIAIQDFESSPATPTWAYSGGGATNGTTSKFNGAASYRISGSQTLTMDNVDISNYTSVSLSVAYAGSGPDSGEDLYMDISYDNGSTWVGTGSVKLVDGFGNTNLDINTTNLSGPTTQASNPWPTSIAGSETQIRVRFRIDAPSGATEYYFIDDVKITGILNTSPTILVSPTSLTGFTQTTAAASAEQTYTVSGNNLTANVSIVPPTGYEISTTTGGAFSATNPITLTQSGGDLVGEPVTIYVRQSASTLGAVSGNITHTSSGSNNPNVAVSGSRTGTYYSKSTGNLDDLANWGLNTDGTGTSPANFTSDGIIYEIRNRATATLGANWVVSGAASKVVVGDGTNATDFTIPSGFTLTGTIDVSNVAELTIENTIAPTFGTFATNSTLEYNNVAVTLSTSTTYRNLKLSGIGTKTFPGNTVTITGNLTLDGTTLNGSSSNPFSTILLAGDLTYVGTVNAPADANSITLSTNGTAAGTQTITGAGNTVRWFRITTTTANTVVLSTTGGTSNIYLGNGAGGGITLFDGSVLNMNGNDFQLFNGTSTGSAAFVMTTGTISTTSATDFTIERTINGALGTLRFTTGSNTIGNLTLNHAGATNTLTIGNALNVTGAITVTDGTLASGGNITLKSNASSTASIAAMGSGGSITGDVTVETFIPGGKRAYRFLGHPFSGTIALSTLIDNIHITGAGVGFDGTGTNNPSAFSFNEATFNGTANSGWSAFTNTANTIGVGQGTRILVRGPRSQSNLLDGTNPTPQAATLDFTGAPNQGNVNVAMGYTGASGANAGWNLIANPYASRVDIGSIASGNRNSIANFSVWAPNNGTRGAYVTTTFGSAYIIPAGSAFFVQTGSAANFTFTEANKSSSAASAILLKTDPFKLNALQLNVTSDDTIFWDQFVLRNREDALESKDAMDANKMENPDVNFYSTTNNNDKFAIDHRPLTANSVVNLGFTTTSDYHFTFKVANLDMPGYDVFLMDKFLNKQTLLSTSTIYNFTTTADANSKGSNRFQLVFNKVANGAQEMNASNNFMAYPNPASSEINISLTTANKGIYQFGVYNQLGQELTTGNFNFNTNTIQTLNIEALGSGVYFIKVSNGDATQTIKFIK